MAESATDKWSVLTSAEREALLASMPREQRDFDGTIDAFVECFGQEALMNLMRCLVVNSPAEDARELARRAGTAERPDWWKPPEWMAD